jgi:hypothetical protein
MASLTPILANEANAAKLLDLPLAEFRALVERGYLPQGREIAPGIIRWPADELRALGKGEKVDWEPKW